MIMSNLTSKRKEKISAFLDNDLHRDELMSFSLSADSDDAQTVQRYQMMGDALRGEMSDASFVDVSHAVREALADENISVENIAAQTDAGKEVRSNTKTGGIFDVLSWSSIAWFKPVVGMTVATLVAVVMVVSLSEHDAGEVVPVASKTEAAPAVQLAVEEKTVEQDPRVNKYLVDQHLEFATQDALQGRLPYVRAVSFESKDKPVK